MATSTATEPESERNTLSNPAGVICHQLFTEIHRWRMGYAAKHDVTNFIDLVFCRGIQHRMVVAVDGAPPRSHAVDQLCAIG